MAEKIRRPWKAPQGRISTYPWEKWTDGDVWKAFRGTDYHITSKGFKSNLRGVANRMGLGVSVDARNPDFVIFQFRSKDGGKLPKSEGNVRALRPRQEG